MNPLSPKERRALRARAHALHPVVIVGAEGLTDAVMAEIERNLAAHELIKVRAAEAERGERGGLLESICSRTGSSPVQHIGKVLVLYRPRPEEAPAGKKSRAGRAARTNS